MKLFVDRSAHALKWDSADGRAASGPRRLDGGRARRFRDLSEWMPALVGLIFLVDLLSVVNVPPLLQYLAFGYASGMAGGKVVVVRRERRSGEMSPDRVRHIELAGMAAGISLMFLAAAVQVVLVRL